MNQFYILFVDGILAGRYDRAIHGDKIPAEAVAVSAELFRQTINETDGVWKIDDEGNIFKDALPLPDPADVIAAQWGAIKVKRDQVKAGGALVGGDWFHTDVDSRIQHLGLKDKARDMLADGGDLADALTIGGQQILWKTMGGAFAPMTAQLAFDIVNAVGILDAQAFQAAEIHRMTMEASESPGDYDFSGGWPAVFEG